MTASDAPADPLAAGLAAIDALLAPGDDRTAARVAWADLAPDPRAALAAPGRLARALAAGPVARRALLACPAALADLGPDRDPPPRDRAAWLAWLAPALAGAADDAALARALRTARRRALVSLGARALADPDALSADLCAFTAACVDAALAGAAQALRPLYGTPRGLDGSRCEATVLGLGAFGAGELLLGAEPSLVFVYATDAGQTDGAGGLGREVSLNTYFSRLFALTVQILTAPGPEGPPLRLDLDARPEGRTGPLGNSLDGLERYYEAFGHPAERLAWVRARPVAGDLALGAEVLATLRPFVFRRHHDYAFADELAGLKAAVDALGARLGRQDGFHVGLGRGGLREIDFTLSALQLTWAGRLPELRAPDSATALARLSLAGLVTPAEAEGLRAAQRFLARVAHLLALSDDRGACVVPADPSARRRLAQLAMAPSPEVARGDDPLPAFELALSRHRHAVSAAFDALAAAGARPPEAEAAEAHACAVALTAAAGAEARDAALRELGFSDPALARARVDALARLPDGPFHPAALAQGGRLAHRLVAAATASGDPDAALGHTESLLRALRHRRAALEQLEQDPRRLRTLAGLFGTSHMLSRLLVRSPGLLERLVFDGSEPAVRSPAELAAALTREPGADGDWEAVLGAVRRFHQAEILRVGFFDLAGLLDPAAAARQRSELAELLVGRVLGAAARHLGAPALASAVGVVALGRLGARELGYAGELDLLFTHGEDVPADDAARLARRTLTGLTCATPEGTLYGLDARERPSGRRGPPCVTLAGLRARHAPEGPASAWERRSMLRARVVHGGAAVIAIVAAARAAAWGSSSAFDVAAEVAAARARLESAAELDPGVAREEAERLVALAQLTSSRASLVAANTVPQDGMSEFPAALAGLVALGRLPQAAASAVGSAWAALRELDERLHLVADRRSAGADPAGAEAIAPLPAAALLRLARRMGYGEAPGAEPGEALRVDLRRHRAAIADGYSQMIWSTRDD